VVESDHGAGNHAGAVLIVSPKVHQEIALKFQFRDGFCDPPNYTSFTVKYRFVPLRVARVWHDAANEQCCSFCIIPHGSR
jgi:hypothetical protein